MARRATKESILQVKDMRAVHRKDVTALFLFFSGLKFACQPDKPR
jgi:hypothetical protein